MDGRSDGHEAVVFVGPVASCWAAHSEITIIDLYYRMCSLLNTFICLSTNLLGFLQIYNVCFACFIFYLLHCLLFISSVICFAYSVVR